MDSPHPFPREPGPAARPLSVLVVEDSADAAQMLADLLALDRHAVRVAPTGSDAIRQATSDPPDVIVLDIGLPDVSGWEVARQLRQGGGPRPYLVAVTGRSSNADRAASAAAGIDLHLIKPVDPDALLRLLSWYRAGRDRDTGPPLPGLVRVCAWCRRVFAGGGWRVGIPDPMAAVSHGMCPPCFAAAMAQVE